MHLEAVIEEVWRCTSRPPSGEVGYDLRCQFQSGLAVYMEVVDQGVVAKEGGALAAGTHFIG